LNEKLSQPDVEDEDFIIRSHYELGIVRRFDFTSKLMRMSTLVKNVNEPYFKGFCKGSPEKIKELCKQDTVPPNFNEILSKYTTKGYRVLALSVKLLKMDYLQSQKIERNIVESNMIFLGLLIVQNKLKHNTTNSIEKLANSNLRMVMATGDNLLTAISVAKECNLINPESSVFTCNKN
jgi:magnesium-transporting ATPase (P-type)